VSGGTARLLHQLTRFLLGSCLGLTVDLGIFAAGTGLGAPPWLANMISAGCAVVVVYLFVTKYAFGGGRSRSSFLWFVAWYVLSIAVFSVLIDLLHGATGWPAFLCKLVSLPFSFAANFGVSKVLFRERPSEAALAGAGGAPRRDAAA
jgi:putative flippase GtrA